MGVDVANGCENGSAAGVTGRRGSDVAFKECVDVDAAGSPDEDSMFVGTWLR